MLWTNKFVVLVYLWNFNFINSALLLDSIDNYLITFFNGCISPATIWVKCSSFDINLVKFFIDLLRDNDCLIYFKILDYFSFIFRSFWLTPLALNLIVELFICWELYYLPVFSYSLLPFTSSSIFLVAILMKDFLYFNSTFLGPIRGDSGLLISIDFVYGKFSNQFPYFLTGLIIYAFFISRDSVFMCYFYKMAGFSILLMKQGTCLK